MSVLDKLKHHYREAKASIEGKAISKARLIKTLTAIAANQLLSRKAPRFTKDRPRRRLTFKERMQWLYERRPRPTQVGLRLLDGRPVVFFSDGSLRHAYGRSVAKAAYKKLKRARRRKLDRTLVTA